MFPENDLKQLAIDMYNDRSLTYNDVPAEDAFRKMIFEAMGVEKGETLNYYAWEDNKNKVFQILSTAVDAVLPTILVDQFDSFADIRQVASGDKPQFKIEDNSLFHVSMIASGTQDLQRQELLGGSFTVDTDWYGTAVYAEFEKLLVGQINWKSYVDRVATSFSNFIQTRTYEAFANSYDTLRAVRKVEGTYDEDKLMEVAQHIQAASGGKGVEVYGTLAALRKVSRGADKSGAMKDRINQVGYLDTVAGLDLIALPQAYKAGKEEFAIDDNTLIVLPKGEKIVTIVLEGETIVKDSDGNDRNDLQREFKTLKKLGVRVAALSVYGMYKLS
ncbi:hypothetical protein [Enterococcus mundtii]|uniref:hypothetical protein n=1 Tax=Enterococcus mundtii TaxID=53346 RepID=UPI001A972636|nr:hypothetical protein [Enterococcus mundtii]MBO1087252.1 hypothetical protein [Enterococcus mundtii]